MTPELAAGIATIMTAVFGGLLSLVRERNRERRESAERAAKIASEDAARRDRWDRDDAERRAAADEWVRQRLGAWLEGAREEQRREREQCRQDIEAARAEGRLDLEKVREEMQGEVDSLRSELETAEADARDVRARYAWVPSLLQRILRAVAALDHEGPPTRRELLDLQYAAAEARLRFETQGAAE